MKWTTKLFGPFYAQFSAFELAETLFDPMPSQEFTD